MTKVWVVTGGSYSDYHIVRIFSTEELATAYATTHNDRGSWRSSDLGVEEWELDEDADAIRAGRFWWGVWMKRDGEVIFAGCEGIARPDIPETDLIRDTFSPKDHKPLRLRTYVESPTAEHAIKVANERRAQLIANGHWPEETT